MIATMDYESIQDFKERVLAEMRKMSATENELALADDEVIKASMSMGHEPEDVAWALLQ